MKKRELVAFVWAVAAVIAILPMAAGCGGGSSSISYDGSETASAVAGTTAAEYLTNGYGVVDAASVLAATMAGPVSVVPGSLSADVLSARTVTIIYTNTVVGNNDGFYEVDWLVNTLTGDFTGTISYEGYSSRPGESVTGTADAEGTGFNRGDPPDEIALTFSSLDIVKWGAAWKSSGSMEIKNYSAAQQGAAVPLVFLSDSQTIIESMLFKDPDGVTMKLENAEIDVDFDNAFYRFTIEEYGLGSQGARLYHPDHGYLHISTLEPIPIDNETGAPYPGWGVLQITDEAGALAWLWLSTQGSTLWEVWLDGGNYGLDYGTQGGEPDDIRITGGTFEDGVFSVMVPG